MAEERWRLSSAYRIPIEGKAKLDARRYLGRMFLQAATHMGRVFYLLVELPVYDVICLRSVKGQAGNMVLSCIDNSRKAHKLSPPFLTDRLKIPGETKTILTKLDAGVKTP